MANAPKSTLVRDRIVAIIDDWITADGWWKELSTWDVSAIRKAYKARYGVGTISREVSKHGNAYLASLKPTVAEVLPTVPTGPIVPKLLADNIAAITKFVDHIGGAEIVAEMLEVIDSIGGLESFKQVVALIDVINKAADSKHPS